MRAVFVGGGTVGHLSPAVAVAQRFMHTHPEAEAFFIGARRELDREVLSAQGLPFELVSGSGMPYGLSPAALLSLLRLCRGSLETARILRRRKPGVALATGGYVAAAAIPALHLRRIPLVIHVSDALPDRTSLRLGRYAHTITVAFEAAAEHFPAEKVVVTGQPIRKEILATDRPTAREALGLDPRRFVLAVSGGSQGAHTLNQAVLDALPALKQAGIQVLHLTGQREYEAVSAVAAEDGWGPPDYLCRAYEPRMGMVLAAADTLLTRAGSSGLAEAAAWRVPMIVVPYPHAHGHQKFNARPLDECGAAVVVDDEKMNGALLTELTVGLAEDIRRREEMSKAAESWAKMGAAEAVADLLGQLAVR